MSNLLDTNPQIMRQKRRRAEMRRRLRRHIKLHPEHNQSTLGQQVRKSRSWLSSVLKGDIDPSFSSIVDICLELGITPNDIAGFDEEIELLRTPEASTEVERQADALLNRMMVNVERRLKSKDDRPSIEDVITWWHENGGRLEGYCKFVDHVDLIRIPEATDTTVSPYVMGSMSVASRALTNSKPERLNQFLSMLTDAERRDIVVSYFQASKGLTASTVHTIVVDMPDMQQPLPLKYCRTLLPVSDARGGKYIMNYSKQIE